MHRRLYRIACCFSFFLCLLLCILWVRSLNLADYITLVTHNHSRDLYCELGSLQYVRSDASGASIPGWSYEGIRNPFAHYLADAPGGLWGRWSWDCDANRFHWSVPLWLLVVFTALSPSLWVYRHGAPARAKLLFPAAVALWPIELVVLAPTLGWEVEREGGYFAARLCLWATAIAIPLLMIRDCVLRRVRQRSKPWPWQFRAVRRYRRQLRGLCMECGYNVRASRRVCSECGTPIAGRAGYEAPATTN